MFKNDAEKNIEEIANFFSNYDLHKTHSRPLNLKKIEHFNLNIQITTGELSDLLWEAWLLINGVLSISNFYKLFENAHRISWGRQFPTENLKSIKNVEE